MNLKFVGGVGKIKMDRSKNKGCLKMERPQWLCHVRSLNMQGTAYM